MIQKLSTPFACAIPNDTPVDPKGVHTIAGAGPYYIADFTPNRSIVLKKNPNYTGDRPAYADEIDYTQLTIDPNQGTLEAKNGQLDYINDAVVPAQNFAAERAVRARTAPRAARSGSSSPLPRSSRTWR